MKSLDLSEAEISKQISRYFDISKIFYYRQNTGAMKRYDKKTGKTAWIKFGTIGASDYVVCYHGCFIPLEVKKRTEYNFLVKNFDRIKAGKCRTKRDFHLFDQISFIENANKAGAKGLFVCSLNQVVEHLREIGRRDV